MASAAVQALDSQLGKPPFAVTPALMDASHHLLAVLRGTPLALLSKEKHVTDTLPILATSLVLGFNSALRDAVPFVRIVVECVTEIATIAKYPLAQFLKDMRNNFPLEPLVFRLHDAASAISDVEVFRHFLFVPHSKPSPTPPPQPSKKNGAPPKVQSQQLVGELCAPDMIVAMCRSKSLSPECKKVLVQQLDNATKFTKAVRSDAHCAKVVLDLLGASIVADLRPSALHGCLDDILLPHYINLHQLHSDGLGILAEPAAIGSWSLAAQWRMVQWLAAPSHPIDGSNTFGYLVCCAVVLRELSSTAEVSPPEGATALFPLLMKTLDASLTLYTKPPERWEHVIVPLRIISESVSALTSREAKERQCESLTATNSCDVTNTLTELSTMLLKVTVEGLEKRREALPEKTKKSQQQKKVQPNERDALRLQWFGDPSLLCAAVLSIVANVDQCHHRQFGWPSLLVGSESFVGPLLCNGVLPKLPQLKSEVVSQIVGLLDVISRHPSRLPASLVVKLVTALVRKEGLFHQQLSGALTPEPTHSHSFVDVMTRFLSMLDPSTIETLPLVDACRESVSALLGSFNSEIGALGLSASYLRFIENVSEHQRKSAAVELARLETRGGATAEILLTQLEALAASCTALASSEERNVASMLCSCMADVIRSAAEADARCKEIAFLERVEAMRQRIEDDTRRARRLQAEAEALRAARAQAEQKREEVSQEAAVRLAQQHNRQKKEEEQRKAAAQLRLSKLHQEAKALRQTREAALRASVLAYKQRTAKSRDIETFLKRLDIAEARALAVTSQLYHTLDQLSEEQVTEFLVTGSTVVPADMEELRKQLQATSLSNEILETPFWELVKKDVGSGVHIDVATTSAPPECEPKPPAHSVHYNLSPLLDLFDFESVEGGGGDEGEGQAPPCRVIPAQLIKKVLDPHDACGLESTGYQHSSGALSIPRKHGFDDAMHMVFDAQSRGLVVLEKGTVALTMLGFAYHCAFWDSERSLRVRLRQMMAQVPLTQPVKTSLADDDGGDDDDGSVSDWDESDWFE